MMGVTLTAAGVPSPWQGAALPILPCPGPGTRLLAIDLLLLVAGIVVLVFLRKRGRAPSR